MLRNITTEEIEVALANLFAWRRNIIIPGVGTGINIHECDLLVIRLKSSFAIEVEIKITYSDFINESKKYHNHSDPRIREFYFAFPRYLYDKCKDLIPDRAGIILCSRIDDADLFEYGSVKAFIHRRPKINKSCIKLTYDEIFRIAWLGTMRIWSLKRRIIALDKTIRRLKLKKDSL